MHTLTAIIKLTLIEFVRRRIPLVMGLFFLVMVYAIPYIVIGDGTVKGNFQLILTYTLGFTTFFLAVFNMFLSVNVLRKDWRDKVLFVLDSKPVARYQVLLGKFIGLCILNAFLLAIVYGFTLFNINSLERDYQKQASLNKHLDLMPGDLSDAKATVLSARSPLKPLLNKMIVKYQKERKKTISIKSGKWFHWQFKPEEVSKDVKSYTLRYKFYTSSTTDTYKVRATWIIGNPTKDGGFIRLITNNSVNLYHELKIPAKLFKKDEILQVSLGNFNKDSILVKIKDGLVVLVQDRSFTFNLLIAFVILFIQVIFLAAIGLSFSTCLSSNVSLLCVLAFYVLLLSGGIVKDLTHSKILPKEQPTISAFDKGYNLYTKSLASVVSVMLPDYVELSPMDQISRGVTIGGSFLLFNVVGIGLRLLLVLCFACIVFATRELGLIQDIS